MVTKAKAKRKLSRAEVKRIVDNELKKGAVIYSRRLLYRTTRTGGEIQTDRLTGERWLLHRELPERIRTL